MPSAVLVLSPNLLGRTAVRRARQCSSQTTGGSLCRASAEPRQSPGRRMPYPADYKDRVRLQFEQRAPQYDVDLTYHEPLAQQVVQAARLGLGQRVLDVGAGTGLVALQAAQLVGPTGYVLAVDLSEGMLAQARDKAQAHGLQSVDFMAADIEALQQGVQQQAWEGHWDAILCSSALPFLQDIPASLAAWRRWLRSGGCVAFNTPMNSFTRAFTIYSDILQELLGFELCDPAGLFATPEAAHNVMHAAGFTDVRVDSSASSRLYPGRTAEEYAASMWRVCSSYPGLPLAEVAEAEQLQLVEQRFLQAVVEHARSCVVPEGISDPFVMLLVRGIKPS